MIQQTLTHYIEFHQNRLLQLLWDCSAHTNDEVLQVAGKQYNARILELRRQGYDIVSTRQDGKFCFALLAKIKRWEE